jgi:hypothetical protein
MTTYTNNIPQGNQTIASTQPLIQANFGFLQSAINQEHNFNTTDPTQTYHLQASMPNISDPGSLPSGTNGIYYVNGGFPKFYNGSANFLPYSSCSSYTLSGGPITLSLSPTVITSVPAASCGYIYIFRTSSSSSGYFIGSFNSDSSSVNIHGDHGSNIALTTSGLQISAITNGSTYSSVKWVIQVNTP